MWQRQTKSVSFLHSISTIGKTVGWEEEEFEAKMQEEERKKKQTKHLHPVCFCASDLLQPNWWRHMDVLRTSAWSASQSPHRIPHKPGCLPHHSAKKGEVWRSSQWNWHDSAKGNFNLVHVFFFFSWRGEWVLVVAEGWMSLRSHWNTLPEGGCYPLLELTQSLSQR